MNAFSTIYSLAPKSLFPVSQFKNHGSICILLASRSKQLGARAASDSAGVAVQDHRPSTTHSTTTHQI